MVLRQMLVCVWPDAELFFLDGSRVETSAMLQGHPLAQKHTGSDCSLVCAVSLAWF